MHGRIVYRTVDAVKSFIYSNAVWILIHDGFTDQTWVISELPLPRDGIFWKNTSIYSLTICIQQSLVDSTNRLCLRDRLRPVVDVVVDVVAGQLVDHHPVERLAGVDRGLDVVVLQEVAQLPLERARVEVLQHVAVVHRRLGLARGEPDHAPDVVHDLFRAEPKPRPVEHDLVYGVADVLLQLGDEVVLCPPKLVLDVFGVEVKRIPRLLAEPDGTTDGGERGVDLVDAVLGPGFACLPDLPEDALEHLAEVAPVDGALDRVPVARGCVTVSIL